MLPPALSQTGWSEQPPAELLPQQSPSGHTELGQPVPWYFSVPLRLQVGSIMPRRLQPPSWPSSIVDHGTDLSVKEDPSAEGNFVRDSSKSDKS